MSLAVLLASCSLLASHVQFRESGPGTTKETAIEVCRPSGERAYLARLRCPGGGRPSYSREGSVGQRLAAPPGAATISVFDSLRDPAREIRPGEIDQHIVDAYRVRCGLTAYTVFLDMYHCGDPAPATAPPGFEMHE